MQLQGEFISGTRFLVGRLRHPIASLLNYVSNNASKKYWLRSSSSSSALVVYADCFFPDFVFDI
ncbi:hypothetical protein Scep_005030 [Stephania cephalantha]|uniref:Uncharacterized protein n=1 Tax=Stephania cephalantha TaxID=152367 RepID=A0AAP0PZP6_9MAGN